MNGRHHTARPFHPMKQHRECIKMTIHSAACELVLAELLSAPIESVDHRMAERIETLDDEHARDYLLEVFDEDPADSRPVVIGRRIWPLLAAEVAR